jgi:hypothetical protein
MRERAYSRLAMLRAWIVPARPAPKRAKRMANGPTEQRWKVLESGMENEIYSQKLDLHGIPGVGMIQSALLQKNHG